MKKVFGLAALLFAAFLATKGTTLAQPYDCIIIDGQKCYVYYNDDGTTTTDCDGGSTGQGDFKSQSGAIPDKGDVNTTLTPTNIEATVNDPTYGDITTKLDPDRDPTPTTITSVRPGSRYPLDVEINFYAVATLASQEGKVYESATELKFASSDVNSVNPFKNETLTLQSDVDFYLQGDDSHTPVFTLQAGTTSVTLGSSGDPGDGGDNGEVR